MNVLVWKGYGEIEIFSAESVQDVDNIIRRVNDIFEYWKDYEASNELSVLIEKVKKHSIDVNDSEQVIAKRLRNNLFKFLQNRNLTEAYDVDEFEYFHFQEVQQID